MTILNLGLSFTLCLAIILTCYHWWRGLKERSRNEKVAEELYVLVEATHKEIAKNKKLVDSARQEIKKSLDTLEAPVEFSENPKMLASVLTVIVGKFGSLRLSSDDFVSVGDEASVSVYIDTTTNDLILSLNNTLSDDGGPVVMPSYGGDDDETFH